MAGSFIQTNNVCDPMGNKSPNWEFLTILCAVVSHFSKIVLWPILSDYSQIIPHHASAKGFASLPFSFIMFAFQLCPWL